jgi:hypothetical protein
MKFQVDLTATVALKLDAESKDEAIEKAMDEASFIFSGIDWEVYQIFAVRTDKDV